MIEIHGRDRTKKEDLMKLRKKKGDLRSRPNGFTVLEMMIVMLVVAVLLMITLPNVQSKN